MEHQLGRLRVQAPRAAFLQFSAAELLIALDRESPGFPVCTGTWRARLPGLGVDAYHCRQPLFWVLGYRPNSPLFALSTASEI
jgi:hypothetical protein